MLLFCSSHTVTPVVNPPPQVSDKSISPIYFPLASSTTKIIPLDKPKDETIPEPTRRIADESLKFPCWYSQTLAPESPFIFSSCRVLLWRTISRKKFPRYAYVS